MSRIVGIFLVRDEEYFIAWSLKNVVNFCDRIIVLDNESVDRTAQIVNKIREEHSHIELIKVANANNTQKYLKNYFGTETWVLGVDGDEIHDPAGLARMRNRIKSGEFDDYWSISSRYLHVTNVDLKNSLVSGFTSPPAKAGLKLFNFNAIDNWDSKWRKRERLHGKGLVFRNGYSKDHTYRFSHEISWDCSDFRCLHLCFFRRSPLDNLAFTVHKNSSRKNPAESRRLRVITRKLGQIGSCSNDYRKKRYARGNIATFCLNDFNRPADFKSVDSEHEQVMAYLERVEVEIS